MVFDVFIGVLANPVAIAMMGVSVFIGVLLGIFLKPGVGNKVLKFQPSEHRFQELKIAEETAISIECEKEKGSPKNRFFKHSPGFVGMVGRFIKKPITIFLGMEGTAYTWKLEAGKWINLGTLAQAVRSVWGEDFWRTVPKTMQNKLKASKIDVTVELEKAPLTPQGMRVITEEDIKEEEDRRAAQTFWHEVGTAVKGQLINLILAAGTGFGIALALQILGVLDISPVIVEKAPEVANQTAAAAAQFIRPLLGGS